MGTGGCRGQGEMGRRLGAVDITLCLTMTIPQHDRPFLWEFESLGQLHDFWSSVVLKAPDKFEMSFIDTPIDQHQAFLDAFESLRGGFKFVRAKLKDERLVRILEELVQMSFEFFSTGERKRGIQALQECEGLIWPSQAIRLELVADAERRAFGEVQRFGDVRRRRYDGEGSAADLGQAQRALFDYAHAVATSHIRENSEFKPMYHVISRTGEVREVKQSSQKKIRAEIERLVKADEIDGFVRTEYVFLGVLIHDIEQRGKPHISARATVKDNKVGSFRYFLDDPTMFPLGAGDA